MKDGILHIRLLGGFSVLANGRELSGENARSARLWRLFRFMAVNRRAPVPTERLLDLLWEEQELDNPLGALYTLMYRLRALLNSAFDQPHEFFLFRQGCYEWDPKSPVEVDADRFEIASAAALNCSDPADSERLLLDAVQTYSGPLFATLDLEAWMITARELYRRRYARCVSSLCALWEESQQYDRIVSLCESALGFDPAQEDFHFYLIRALIGLRQYARAQKHADTAIANANELYGAPFSSRLTQLADSIRYHGNQYEPEANRIAEQLLRPINESHPFLCDLDAFRKILLLERRAAIRAGRGISLACVSILRDNGETPDNEEMDAVLSALSEPKNFALRASDVLSQYSRNQLLALLPGADVGHAQIAMRRFSDCFFKNSGISGVRFQISIAAL